MVKDKVLYTSSAFSVKALDPATEDESIFIEGYASTNDIDRAGDVVSPQVWENGIKNYLKNPIILANHDYEDAAGRMVEHKIDSKGLWIKARISPAAEIYGLVKDKVLTAFSIGFKIVDAEYNAAADVFLIKEVELLEISVVSVPCNQNTLFSLAKSFDDSAEELVKFKKQFAPLGTSAKGLESQTEADGNESKEWKMNPEEIKQMLADAAKNAAEEATKSLLAAQAQAAAEKAAAEKANAELEARIKAQVEATVKTVDTGAERLLAEVTQRLEAQTTEAKSALAGLEDAIKEKAAELVKIQASKMEFANKGATKEDSYKERETAVLLSKMAGKSIENTRFGRELVEKVGAHLPSATWELEVSLNMEQEVRRRLVVAPNLRSINMKTNVMTIPVNPEAGTATWVTNAQFGTAASAGNTATHQLKEITLNAYKVATNEYLAYEEEEDSLLALMPVVRDAMVRRTARALDKAFINGAGSGADPVAGLATYTAASAGDTFVSLASGFGTTAVKNLRAARKALGAWGLDPSEVIYIVSTDLYYALLEDPTFQTMDKVGTQATVLTGQIGQVAGSPVLVSAELPAAAAGTATALTNLAALAIAPGNFIVGNQRGLRFDTQDLVETQRKVLVASLRTGMTRITNNLGSGVAAVRYTT